LALRVAHRHVAEGGGGGGGADLEPVKHPHGVEVRPVGDDPNKVGGIGVVDNQRRTARRYAELATSWRRAVSRVALRGDDIQASPHWQFATEQQELEVARAGRVAAGDLETCDLRSGRKSQPSQERGDANSAAVACKQPDSRRDKDGKAVRI